MNQKTLNVIYGFVIIILIAGVVYFAMGRKSEQPNSQQTSTNNINSTQPTNQTNPTSRPTPSKSNLTSAQIFSEVASQLNLTRSQLSYFRIFGQDKVQYSFGSGANFAYEYGGKWYLAGNRRNIQDEGDCTEYSSVPEQYRPVCYDVATGQDKYMDSQRRSVNYPLSQMTSYVGE